MRSVLRVVSVFALFCVSVSAGQDQKPAAEFKIPPEAAKAPNPVKPSASSLATAKKTYGYDCAMCHGKDGDGKGDLASDMKLTMLDYTDPAALKDKTDGELFYIIKNGKGDMPTEGDRAKNEEIWSLVNYVRSLAKKDSKPKT
jgi:mono/diheme cytochrome c family protein